MPNEPDRDLKWLVEHRSKNQQLALELYKILGSERLSKESKDSHLITAAGFLVSIIFSLWRAVFICPPTYNRDETFAAAKEFLGDVIEDNMINYTREKKHQNWTFSYFLTNAALRLETLSGKTLSGEDFNILDPEVAAMLKTKLRDNWRDRKEAWCLCHEAAEAAVHKLGTLLRDC
jgi:hypothetical protein